jgi:hypothetical protein
MPKPVRKKFTIPTADKMRAEVGVTANRLAGRSNCSLKVTQGVLVGSAYTRAVCERIINGLQALGHKTAAYIDIVPVSDD